MHQATFDLFRQLILEVGGIALGEKKITLLRTRIRGRMTQLKIQSPESYLKYIRNDSTGEELTHLIDAIATNYTFFFRENKHFEVLEKHLQDLLSNGQRRIRIWSAASSSGEEPYSIAMVIRSVLNKMGLSPEQVDVKILATDISTKILRKAIQGIYFEKQLEKVPATWRELYFKPIDTARGRQLRVSESLREMISFRHMNLNASGFPIKGPFDVIFCRNVMIYFDEPTRKKLVNKFSRVMPEGALLFVGLTESVMGYCKELPYTDPSVYQKTTSPSLAVANA